ncbi:helix-turn-helix domain-containing protein [Polyangium jinanense]|uniref:Helix-turn-helix transcriptional regulator n=1 Tax=Polyangium jinanense TaxID=2829994 RepID=A0A9X4AZ09_9BACT|nr:helix-turn-helix transcriptional regulator [Polyangium jinanense]MDC3962540.1 helix-turn-helix transcriptional regulator [Polyangium jinanense]MDC3989361.1 helix-turn-helix transcriptional regulator [Polyangium jinanense]
MNEHDQGPDHDKAPESLPAILTIEQADRVRKALAPFVAGRSAKEASEAIGYAPKYVQAFLRGEIHCTLHFATGVAHALGIEVEILVQGDST